MLSSKYRLNARKDFQTILKKGYVGHGRFFFVKYLPFDSENSMFGIIVSNKVDKRSSKRNFIKRQLRDHIRLHILPKLTKNIKAVLVARPLILGKKNKFIQDDLTEVFQKLKIIKI
ncbi:MAG: ribonuclease P protein component [Patescibacteria group bacterium]